MNNFYEDAESYTNNYMNDKKACLSIASEPKYHDILKNKLTFR